MRYLILILVIILQSCMHYQANKTAPLIFDKQGHRGCRSLMPENTIPAMIKAIDLGVTTLEMDVVITKDKQVVLSHEPFFNHDISTKPNGEFVTVNEERALNIYQMTYEETKMFDVGLKPHPRFVDQQKIKVSKPLLTDVIDSVEAYCKNKKLAKVYYNIETKTQPLTDNIYHPAPENFVDLLMQVILLKVIDDSDRRTLNEQLVNLGFVPSIYSPQFSLITNKLIKNCNEKQMRVIPWTVDDLLKMKDLKSMGVDGIITDDPSLF